MSSDSSTGEGGEVAAVTAVFKFGGTSLGDGARIRHVAGLVVAEDRAPVVVVSAMAGVTDQLEAVARALNDQDRSAPVVQEALDSIRRRHLDALDELEPSACGSMRTIRIAISAASRSNSARSRVAAPSVASANSAWRASTRSNCW